MVPSAADACSNGSPENFARNFDELLDKSIEKVRSVVELDNTILPSLKNKAVIEGLFHQGIFELKESVQFVADRLVLSHHTVYRHLRELKNKGLTN